MRTLLLIAILTVAAEAATQHSNGQIGGIVVRAATGEPFAAAEVQLTPPGSLSPLRAQPTSADGRFEFPDVPPGRYTVRARSPGHFSVPLHGLTSQWASRQVSITSEDPDHDVELSLQPAGAIEGTIYDSADIPVSGVSVSLERLSYTQGRRVRTAVKTDRTDDRGQYRIFDVPPGEWFLMAQKLRTPRDGEPATRTFYPGVIDVAVAVPLDFGAGTELPAMDIHLISRPGRPGSRVIGGALIQTTPRLA